MGIVLTVAGFEAALSGTAFRVCVCVCVCVCGIF
jgi:hypothetical protein